MQAKIQAQNITYKNTPQPKLTFATEDDTAYAIFRRLDDVWIVSDGQNTPLQPPSTANTALVEAENLHVQNGTGVRLRFERLSQLHVTRQDDVMTVHLNAPSKVKPLDVTVATQNNKTVLKKPLGSGHMLNVTSFQTGENYIVLPTYLNRGVENVREVGDVRLLKTAVGAVFVSREGLPMGVEEQQNESVFTPMTDALSKATSRHKKTQTPAFVDGLLAQLTQAKQEIQQNQNNTSLGHDDNITIPPMTGRKRATFDAAINRMQSAVHRVDALIQQPAPLKVPQEPKMPEAPKVAEDVSEEMPKIKTDDLIAALKKKIQDEEITPPTEIMPPEEIPPPPAEKQVLADDALFPDFGQRSPSDFNKMRKRLRRNLIVEQRPVDKTKAAHMYAGLLIQMNRAIEALGVLQTSRQKLKNAQGRDEDVVADELAKTRLIEAIANVMLERFADAQDLLEKNKPSNARDLWLGVVQTGLGAYKAALPLLEENIEESNTYPPLVGQAARYYYAKNLFENNNFSDSMTQLDELALRGGNNRFLPKGQLLMGRNYQAKNQLDNAEKVYINLANHPNKKVARFALLYFLGLLDERGELAAEAAIVRYENLRFLWRGDKVEEESLYQLGQLYNKTNQHRKALERLRSLTANFPESEHADNAAAQMTKIYEDVLMGRVKSQDESKLYKLAIYYDFRALTPSGKEGDALVTLVAEDLASLGLYQRAIDILQRQLQFRVRDRDAVGQLGYELAGIHAQKFQLEEGLKVLQRTSNSRLPQSLKNQRKRLKAKILALDRRPQAALKTALEVDTPAGRTQQAGLAWELGRNQVIIQALADRFNGAGGADWEDGQATQFLQLVTALSRTGQRERLAELRLNYQPGIQAHGIGAQVLFLLQAADDASPLPEEADLPENPTSFWPKATKALAAQNKFNNNYRALRKRWQEEKEQARRTERAARNQELRRPRR